LDPYYRTLNGFISLVEKEWLSFGHKFSERCGHIYHGGKEEKETAPVFHQFLECTHHLLSQYPEQFEFNQRLLIDLYHHHYSCQFGTFLKNNEQERWQAQLNRKTQSFWSFVLENTADYIRWLPVAPCGTLLPSAHPKWLYSFPALWFQFDDDVWGGSLEADPLATIASSTEQTMSNFDDDDDDQVLNIYRRWGACDPDKVLAEFEDKVQLMEDSLKQAERLIAHLEEKLTVANIAGATTENGCVETDAHTNNFPVVNSRRLKCNASGVAFCSADRQWICRRCMRRISANQCRHQTALYKTHTEPELLIDTGISVRVCDDCFNQLAPQIINS
jgi:hypothetical protein